MARPLARSVSHLSIFASPLDESAKRQLRKMLEARDLPAERARRFVSSMNGAIVDAFVFHPTMTKPAEQAEWLSRVRKTLQRLRVVLGDVGEASGVEFSASEDQEYLDEQACRFFGLSRAALPMIVEAVPTATRGPIPPPLTIPPSELDDDGRPILARLLEHLVRHCELREHEYRALINTARQKKTESARVGRRTANPSSAQILADELASTWHEQMGCRPTPTLSKLSCSPFIETLRTALEAAGKCSAVTPHERAKARQAAAKRDSVKSLACKAIRKLPKATKRSRG